MHQPDDKLSIKSCRQNGGIGAWALVYCSGVGMRRPNWSQPATGWSSLSRESFLPRCDGLAGPRQRRRRNLGQRSTRFEFGPTYSPERCQTLRISSTFRKVTKTYASSTTGLPPVSMTHSGLRVSFSLMRIRQLAYSCTTHFLPTRILVRCF